VVLDNHNVESVLYREIGESATGNDLQARMIRDIVPSRTEAIERRAVNAVDQVWVCSEKDRNLMADKFGTRVPVFIVANGIDTKSYSAERLSSNALPDSRKTRLVFPAAFGYPPNAQAARFLIEELWPRLISMDPQTELILPGSTPSPQMIEASRRDRRIIVTGTVEDTRPYISSASAMVVPLFQGSGTRFKILEAFASGVPVIATSKGAEGLAVNPESDLIIAENADEFAAAVERLRDKALKRFLTENAFRLVKQRYSWDVARNQIDNAVRELQRAVERTLESAL
jgi:glycosyltransferase involved in cell wall biosynthesis